MPSKTQPNNTCKECKGSGNDPEHKEFDCPACNGTGQQPELDIDDMTHEERIEYLKANDLPRVAELYQKALDMSDPKSNNKIEELVDRAIEDYGDTLRKLADE